MRNFVQRILDNIVGSPPSAPRAPSRPVPSSLPSSRAASTMSLLNHNALRGHENGREVFIEDHSDPDGRMYRLEYQCDADGSNAVAYVRHNPWGRSQAPATQCHLFADGRICLGNRSYRLDEAVSRARYFCAAYSYYREHGRFPNP